MKELINKIKHSFLKEDLLFALANNNKISLTIDMKNHQFNSSSYITDVTNSEFNTKKDTIVSYLYSIKNYTDFMQDILILKQLKIINEMKTILIVYSNAKMITIGLLARNKKYAFNTEADIKVGDIIASNTYDTNMVVTEVLDKAYTYYNSNTGEISDNYNSTFCWNIKKLTILDKEEGVVIGKIIK